jgi:hypothetical protein
VEDPHALITQLPAAGHVWRGRGRLSGSWLAVGRVGAVVVDCLAVGWRLVRLARSWSIAAARLPRLRRDPPSRGPVRSEQRRRLGLLLFQDVPMGKPGEPGTATDGRCRPLWIMNLTPVQVDVWSSGRSLGPTTSTAPIGRDHRDRFLVHSTVAPGGNVSNQETDVEGCSAADVSASTANERASFIAPGECGWGSARNTSSTAWIGCRHPIEADGGR